MPIAKRNTGVYVIRNLVNGKVYVGSAALHFDVRKGYHLPRLRKGTHENTYLQRAWNKYGESNFQFEVLETCSPDRCLVREQHWMDFYGSYDRRYGYNICPVAGSVRGTKWSDERRRKGFSVETRRKIGDAKRGVKLSTESIAKRTAKLTGLKRSAETKERLRLSAIKRGISPETRRKMEETKRRNRSARKQEKVNQTAATHAGRSI
jgi:group I intron endonuclease